MNIVSKVRSAGGSLILLIGLISAPAALQAADYYKWVGEDGVVHYGATPPKGVEAELVKTYGGVSTSSQSQSASTPDSNAANGQTSDQPAVQLTPEQIAAKKERCTQERERLAVLSKPGRIRMSQPDGTVTYLSEEDIAREIEITKKVIADSCD